MQKFPLHPSEMHIGLFTSAKKSNAVYWVIGIIAVAAAIYFIYKKYKNEKAKQ